MTIYLGGRPLSNYIYLVFKVSSTLSTDASFDSHSKMISLTCGSVGLAFVLPPNATDAQRVLIRARRVGEIERHKHCHERWQPAVGAGGAQLQAEEGVRVGVLNDNGDSLRRRCAVYMVGGGAGMTKETENYDRMSIRPHGIRTRRNE
jgi:hypothetical protein